MTYAANGAWNAEKVAVFRAAFEEFLNYVYIDSKDEGNIPLGGNLYEAQTRFLDTVFDALSEDIHSIYVLKSRQLGMSTVTRALTVFWLGMHDGLNGAVVLDNNEHKEDARREIEAIIKRLPPKLKFPTIDSANRSSLRLSNGSRINFMSAGTKQTASGGSLGRGIGTNFAHCSEMCTWQNPEGVSSFNKSLSEVFPNRLYIWESTGRGFNQWYDMWQNARADDLSCRCCFLGFWSKPNQSIARGTPAFERYGTAPPTESEQEKIDEVQGLYNHTITPEQLAWYRKASNPRGYGKGKEDIDEDALSDDEYFGREQPWTESDAFAQSGSTFFPAKRLTELTKTDVSDEYTAWCYYPGMDFMDMQVVRAPNRRATQLKIWQEPLREGVYVIAADPAYGANEANDRSAIQILRCYADKVEQVAEFCATLVQPHQLAWIIASLAGYYKQVRFMLEINGPGVAVWQEFTSLKRIITTGYQRQDAAERGLTDIFNNVKMYIYSRPDALIPGSSSIHWKTTSITKVPLMERMRDFTTNGTLILRSRDLLDEMRGVTRDGDAICSEGNDHDDRVLALAIGIQCWEQQERRGLIARGVTREFALANRSMSMQDQLRLLGQYQLDRFFQTKETTRRKAAIAARRASWQGR